MRRALLALLLAGAPFPALAQAAQTPPAQPVADAATIAAAERLIAQMNVTATLDRVFVQLSPVFAQAVLGQLGSEPKTKAMIDTINARAPENHDRMVAILSQEFMTAIKRQYPAYLKQVAAQYAAAFTADELNAIAGFYATGPGAKALRLLPELQAKMSADGRELGSVAGREAGTRAFERIIQEMLPENGSRKS